MDLPLSNDRTWSVDEFDSGSEIFLFETSPEAKYADVPDVPLKS